MHRSVAWLTPYMYPATMHKQMPNPAQAIKPKRFHSRLLEEGRLGVLDQLIVHDEWNDLHHVIQMCNFVSTKIGPRPVSLPAIRWQSCPANLMVSLVLYSNCTPDRASERATSREREAPSPTSTTRCIYRNDFFPLPDHEGRQYKRCTLGNACCCYPNRGTNTPELPLSRKEYRPRGPDRTNKGRARHRR